MIMDQRSSTQSRKKSTKEALAASAPALVGSDVRLAGQPDRTAHSNAPHEQTAGVDPPASCLTNGKYDVFPIAMQYVEASAAAISPVAIRITLTAAPITSAGRFSPRRPLGIVALFPQLRLGAG
jgi:hypothetical protein